MKYIVVALEKIHIAKKINLISLKFPDFDVTLAAILEMPIELTFRVISKIFFFTFLDSLSILQITFVGLLDLALLEFHIFRSSGPVKE